MQITRLDLYSG